ncbi:MAG: sigma-70 family RNA polymerase sigma factor [Phycisphaerales bacterium]|nr:sigma-70 family RNA polymerase sigma factor [Phycisphaerales bacterium]
MTEKLKYSLNQDDETPECDANAAHEAVQVRRQEAAEHIQQQRDTVMRRIHSLLGGGARKITDTEDVLSTTLRRVDKAVYTGRLRAINDAQFYSFVHRVIEQAILEKTRSANRIRKREGAFQRMRGSDEEPLTAKSAMVREDIERMSRVISDPLDREIVFLKGRGLTSALIAESMGMEAAAVRQRWGRMRAKVREMILEDARSEEYE